jgi:hypothetical protein
MVFLSILIWSLSRKFVGAAFWGISYAIQLVCRTGILLYWHDTDGIIQQELLTISTTFTVVGFVLFFFALRDLDKEMANKKPA